MLSIISDYPMSLLTYERLFIQVMYIGFLKIHVYMETLALIPIILDGYYMLKL